jgi:hypothetical protein
MAPMTELPPLPELPATFDVAALADMADVQLDELVDGLTAGERATVAAMAPHQAQLRELRARQGQVATEQRRRERAAHIAARAAVRAQAKSGEMPSVLEALAAAEVVADDTRLADLPTFLRSGGEVRFGYATRPGPLPFTDGRQSKSATTWGEARQLYRDGWEPGSPGVPGVRVHLLGTRVERVVEASEVVVRPNQP